MQAVTELSTESLALLESISEAKVYEIACHHSSLKYISSRAITVASRLITDRCCLFFSSRWITLRPRLDVFVLEITAESPIVKDSAPTEWESILRFTELPGFPVVKELLICSSSVAIENGPETTVEDELLLGLSNGSVVTIKASQGYPAWLEIENNPGSLIEELCCSKHSIRRVESHRTLKS